MQEERNIKLALVGHKGFIGSHLERYFKKNGTSFICFEGDLLSKSDIEEFFLKNKAVTEAVFLAGTFGYDFQKQIEKNILTVQAFLETGRSYGLKKIIYLSSGAVYGEPLHGESRETDPLSPNTLYGLSKLFVEQCIQYYHRNFGTEYIILRLPNVYGENNYKGVIFDFLSDINKYKKITIAGDGSQQRNFLHVEDACSAIEKSLAYEKTDIFNISNPVAISVNDIVKILKKKYSFEITHKPSENNLQKLLLNIDKAKNILHFTPSHIELEKDL